MEQLKEQNFEKTLIDLGCEMIQEEDIEKIKPCIGEGGFGKVYKGNFKDKVVAIKKIKLGDDADKDVFSDILQEIKVVLVADNEDIPKFFGIWKKKKHYHLVFEFIAGENLKDVYHEKIKKEKLLIILELCHILDQFHQKKLIHRDIKPANVMVEGSNNNKVKLIDFGISKIASHTATFTKNQIGTISYMPPEMFDIDPDQFEMDNPDIKPVPVSIKSDIWSLGCLMSEIFSGIKPWCSKIDQKMTDTKITSNLGCKKKFIIPTNIDDDVRALIESACNVDPLLRPSAGELKIMVQKLINEGNEL